MKQLGDKYQRREQGLSLRDRLNSVDFREIGKNIIGCIPIAVMAGLFYSGCSNFDYEPAKLSPALLNNLRFHSEFGHFVPEEVYYKDLKPVRIRLDTIVNYDETISKRIEQWNKIEGSPILFPIIFDDSSLNSIGVYSPIFDLNKSREGSGKFFSSYGDRDLTLEVKSWILSGNKTWLPDGSSNPLYLRYSLK